MVDCIINYFFQNHKNIDNSQFVEVIPFNDNLKLSLNSLVYMFPHMNATT